MGPGTSVCGPACCRPPQAEAGLKMRSPTITTSAILGSPLRPTLIWRKPGTRSGHTLIQTLGWRPTKGDRRYFAPPSCRVSRLRCPRRTVAHDESRRTPCPLPWAVPCPAAAVAAPRTVGAMLRSGLLPSLFLPCLPCRPLSPLLLHLLPHPLPLQHLPRPPATWACWSPPSRWEAPRPPSSFRWAGWWASSCPATRPPPRCRSASTNWAWPCPPCRPRG